MADQNPFACIQELSAGYFASRCLHAVAELDVADALGDAEMDVATLAAATGANPDALSRMLRLLDTHGVFRLEQGRVSQTPASSLLRSDNPTSMRDFVRMFGLPLNWQSAELLVDSLRTGKAGAEAAFEGGFWGRLSANPDEARVFDAAMSAKAAGQIGAIVASYDFSQFDHIVDVGGGQGHLIRAILRACPQVTGTLFDLPHVIEAARAAGDGDGRLAFQAGDFFKNDVPAGDCFILMEVIHDWADEPAAEIIASVKSSAPRDARVLLIETEVPETREPDWSKTLDIVMLTLFAARQRTAAEYQELMAPHGFDLERATDTRAGISVFEFS
jgi:hypothetical protein